MTTGRKRACLVVAVLAAGALVWAVVDQAASYSAHRRLSDAPWMRAATPDELRVTAEHAIGWWFGDPHEAFLILLDHGDQSSVPYLRAALARRPFGGGSCTWGHGEEALERLERLSPPSDGESGSH